MSQQASDTPRFVQILGRYRALIGVMAALGLLAGAVFAALNPPVFTSQALIQFPGWPCPAHAYCAGPVFASDRPGYIAARLLRSLPSAAQVKFEAGNVLLVSTTAGTAARAEATTAADARSYLAYADTFSYPGDQAQILEPATMPTGTPPALRLRDDMLLGALCGALLGVIAALAGGATTVDTPTAPPGYDIGEERSRAGLETRRAGEVTTGVSPRQTPREYAYWRAVPEGRPEMSARESFSP